MSDLPYPPDEGQTHSEHCYRWPRHHNCAVQRYDELQAKLHDEERPIRRELRQAKRRIAKALEGGDRWWCTEGCGLVKDKNHRCEQWSQVLRIPIEAVRALLEGDAD